MNTSDRLNLINKAIRSAVRAYDRGDMKRVGACLAFATAMRADADEHEDFEVATSRGHVRDAGKLERQEMRDQAERHEAGRAL